MTILKGKIFLNDELVAENADVTLTLSESTSPLPTWQGEIETDAYLKIGKEIYTLDLSDGRKGEIRIRTSSIDFPSFDTFSSNEGFR